jgi:glycosyltransferase involved in cell wall biosynthesis
MIRACYYAGATLLLAGRFESERLREKIEKMPQYSCVHYMGSLDRQGVAKLYAHSMGGLLLLDDTVAYVESEPVKLFEYACAGLPIVAGIFEHGKNLPERDKRFLWILISKG